MNDAIEKAAREIDDLIGTWRGGPDDIAAILRKHFWPSEPAVGIRHRDDVWLPWGLGGWYVNKEGTGQYLNKSKDHEGEFVWKNSCCDGWFQTREAAEAALAKSEQAK